MRQFLPLLFLWAAGAILAPAQSATREGAYWVRTIRGGLAGPSIERLRVESAGNVILRGVAGAQAMYVLTARVRARDEREADALLRPLEVRTSSGEGLTHVMVRHPLQFPGSLELTLTVPSALRQTWIETRAGSVEASGLDGDLEARSSGGRITADHIGGAADLRTGGGDIQVGSVNGPVRCLSGGGAVRVQSAGGEGWLETVGGEIFIHQAQGEVHATTAGGNIRIEHAAGAVFARATGGLIQVEQADGAVTAENSGGAIQVNAANGVRCDSAGGAIRLRNVAGALHASASAGSILAELHSGSKIADSALSTNAGDITVFLPSNLPLTVVARNESGGAGRIISDFPQIRPQNSTEPGFRPATAEGSLNGGGPVLRLSVMGGTIYLRREK